MTLGESVPPLKIAFERELPAGVCVGVAIPMMEEGDARVAITGLLDEEQRVASALAARRQPTWVAGRLALRAALQRLGASPGPLLVSARGAPTLPEGFVGSISHKADLAVALAARDEGWRVGVDIERSTMGEQDISRRVLTPGEIDALSELPDGLRNQYVMVSFSLKESIYKSIDPYLNRYVGFHEMAVALREDGGAEVTSLLSSGEALEVQGWWFLREGRVLTCARARLPDESNRESTTGYPGDT
ncbi:4'-phosphopantetheinyl transferase family protein [Haliangium ochraceum]|uniref:Enterobactin synthase component D n=1 Tax=Haliangium ochraceum (strain DSM 14365 / JCM 11303 / SMP-2) TaxID=502025 RepID=D0LIL8_HALO1|nr:4'-phosphopantetheinyl transferase superfamily protein [Haliangium ochraceum]ACY18374.1 4'-phosphopantetheinyl transferase [Haliangium ochraceum DSM 14365]